MERAYSNTLSNYASSPDGEISASEDLFLRASLMETLSGFETVSVSSLSCERMTDHKAVFYLVEIEDGLFIPIKFPTRNQSELLQLKCLV